MTYNSIILITKPNNRQLKQQDILSKIYYYNYNKNVFKEVYQITEEVLIQSEFGIDDPYGLLFTQRRRTDFHGALIRASTYVNTIISITGIDQLMM
jgi:hypothetical protein